MTGGAGYAQRHLEHSDYYDEHRKVQGEWRGRGAELLGLRGGVTREQFEAVREGLHPETGEFLRPRHSVDRANDDGTEHSKARSLYDLTFSAPKSVSIQAMVGGDERLVAAHDKAVRDALAEAESYAATRVRLIRAALVNSGKYSFVEAEEKILHSRLHLEIGAHAARTPAGQAAFLTAVLTGARCFGEVTFKSDVDPSLLSPLPIPATTLAEAAEFLGGRFGEEPPRGRTVLIGAGLRSAGEWSVQASWDGWTASVAPSSHQIQLGHSDCALAGVAAGALAVGQAFFAEQGDRFAGRRRQVLSLWSPGLSHSSTCEMGPSFAQVYLPTQLWLVGLGNLGQAYLWSLSQLPYPACNEALLFLQDDQKIGRENWGTSVLVERGRYNVLKTRVCEEWAIGRGFEVRRIDRRMDENLFRSDREPGIALAGLDGMPARRTLGGRSFEYIVDAGLGATVDDYCKIRVNVFDSSRSPATHFRGVEDQTTQIAERLKQLPVYRDLASRRGDGGCGAALLAESSVAVPFVSAVAGALVVTQAIRIASGQAYHVTITADLRDLASARGTLGHKPERVNIPSTLAAE
jgi:hypothetical protein